MGSTFNPDDRPNSNAVLLLWINVFVVSVLSIVVDALSSVRRDEVNSNSLLVTDLIVSTVSKSSAVAVSLNVLLLSL